jgi:hypothetical protein
MAATIVLGFSTTSFAAEQHVENATEGDEIVSQLSAADYGTEVTFAQLTEEEIAGRTLLKFDSIEEAEAFLKQFITESSELTLGNNISLQSYHDSMAETYDATPSTYKHSFLVGWRKYESFFNDKCGNPFLLQQWCGFVYRCV